MGRRDRREKPGFISRIANERIEILFKLAQENVKTHPKRSKRYVELARKIGTRYLVRFPKKTKLSFCKKCNSPLLPGYNLKVKLNPRHKFVEYTCSCGEVKRISYRSSESR
jgi:ribonuclease P protein subunit RPR2